MNAEAEYLYLLDVILNSREDKDNRTGIKTRSVFGLNLSHEYYYGFPLLTTKKVHFKSVLHELLWFLKGTEDTAYLKENNVKIWDEWMINGKLPHTYGVKWRNFHGVDQIQYVIDEIKNNPSSRRILFSAWDASTLKDTALPWCHVMAQFNVSGCYLDIAVVQRSCDFFLGVPFNIASYSVLLYMIAHVTHKIPRCMYYTFHDSHIYHNHFEQVKLQLSRQPRQLPELKILKQRESIDDFVYEDFELVGYNPHPAIKASVAV